LPVSKIISVPSNPKICIGDSIQLTALGANKYNWSNGILNGKAFSPIKSGTYSLTTIGLNGCSTNDSISIQVNERPIVSISSEKYFCPGNDLILKANTNGLLNQWLLNGNIINGATSVNYTVKQEGIYSLISTNSFGCANNYLVADTILLPSLPIIDFSYDNYCINNKIKFTNLSKAANSLALNWTWSFGLGTSGALIENPVYTYTEAGTYNVSLKVNYAYCPSLSSNLIKKVTIVQPTLNKKYDTVFAEANVNKIISARNIGISYNWKPNIGINDTSIMSPVFKYDLGQSYQIKIIEKSGCVITDTLVVAIIKKEGDIIFVPNAFTPNGDGQNDQLTPFFVGIKKFISFSVYNRWGQLLYKTENQGVGWDGTYSGSKQPIETYVWMCEVLDDNNSIVRKVGQTFLIR
jgi:gliding motility-associated-like protein